MSLRAPSAALLLAGVLLTYSGCLEAAQPDPCEERVAAVGLDHVVLAVHDLPTASREFEERLGFSLKPGRVHDNGLRNVHVRFTDGTALELMATGAGTADELSAAYDRFLQDGEGGAFVALDAGPADTVLRRLGELADSVRVVRSAAMEWVSFPEGHPLRPVFFVHVRSRSPDAPGQLAHRNETTGIAEVWLESSDPNGLAGLLDRFGARACAAGRGPDGVAGLRFGLAGGSLGVVPTAVGAGRARILAVAMRTPHPPDSTVSHGVRLTWRTSGI
ncbi:MAG: VOC family protein [marine benthic group bacterium]|nr:VOC family protein [Candidatus Benthicola marisminoris]